MKRATMQRSMFAEGAICVKIQTAEYTSHLGPLLIISSFVYVLNILNHE